MSDSSNRAEPGTGRGTVDGGDDRLVEPHHVVDQSRHLAVHQVGHRERAERLRPAGLLAVLLLRDCVRRAAQVELVIGAGDHDCEHFAVLREPLPQARQLGVLREQRLRAARVERQLHPGDPVAHLDRDRRVVVVTRRRQALPPISITGFTSLKFRIPSSAVLMSSRG
jgi:hypothetical protein